MNETALSHSQLAFSRKKAQQESKNNGTYTIIIHNYTERISKRKSQTATLQDGIPVQDGATHEHHAIARHCGWRSVVDVVHLKDDLAVGRHGDAVTVSQGQGLVVVQHRVQVLDPDGVHRPIKHQPHVLTLHTGGENVTFCRVLHNC